MPSDRARKKKRLLTQCGKEPLLNFYFYFGFDWWGAISPLTSACATAARLATAATGVGTTAGSFAAAVSTTTGCFAAALGGLFGSTSLLHLGKAALSLWLAAAAARIAAGIGTAARRFASVGTATARFATTVGCTSTARLAATATEHAEERVGVRRTAQSDGDA